MGPVKPCWVLSLKKMSPSEVRRRSWQTVKKWRKQLRRRDQRRANTPPPVTNRWEKEASALAATLDRSPKLPSGYRLPKVSSPASLSFTTDHDGVALFGQRIRTFGLANRPIWVDFTSADIAEPAAALYIAAEMDRARVLTGRKLTLLDAGDWSPEVLDFMYQLGLFDLLELISAPAHSKIGNVIVRKMERHVGIAPVAAEKFRDALAAMIGKSLPQHLATYGAIMEAVANVKDHAYIRPDAENTKVLRDAWWVSASYEIEQKLLQIVFLDQGIGVPQTLPQTVMEILKSIIPFKGDTHSARIQAALQYGRSSTGKVGRGRGFGDMMELVDAKSTNWLRVLSGKGECVYEDGNLTTREHSVPIAGTLVQWTLAVE